jgi:hypothetical protein
MSKKTTQIYFIYLTKEVLKRKKVAFSITIKASYSFVTVLLSIRYSLPVSLHTA